MPDEHLTWWDAESDPRLSEIELWCLVQPVHAVSNLGGLARKNRNESWRRLSGSVNSSGYVTARIGGKTKLVHRLVVEAFDGAPPTDLHTDVRHLDSNKRNNALKNLGWGTRSENMKDVVEHKRSGASRETGGAPRLWTWHSGRLSDNELIAVVKRLYDEDKITCSDCAELLGVPCSTAKNVVRRKDFAEGGTKRTKKRRSSHEASEIIEAIREGLSRAELNQRLKLDLNHQAFYYFKTRAGL